MNKTTQRKTALAARKNIFNKAEKDRLIFERFVSSELYKKSGSLFIYCSTADEIDTDQIREHAFSHGKRVCVPVCGKSQNMSFFEITKGETLKKGSMGIREPDASRKSPVFPDECSLIVTPGLVFDLSGNRIGYGGGYYDKYLSQGSFATIGLCYDEFVVQRIDAEEFDIPVQNLITEKRIITFTE